ncbi:hypothetical protein LTR17_014385 [Elasticomyces elasticus]|nr:hypothetical protein LTR17_014385 [Elasticomyces elasticus]
MPMRSALVLPRRHVAHSIRRAYVVRPVHPPRRKPAATPQPIDPSYPVGKPTPAEAPAPPRSTFAPWIFGALSAGIGFYTLQLYLAASKPCLNPHIAELTAQQDVAERYDYTAASFDSEVGFSELLMGVNGLRKKLARKCHGDVLEVSCGTGRNLGYYDIEGAKAKVESLAFIDLSPQMVDVCRQKWAALFGSEKAKQRLHPELKNMARHLDMSNPDARILLLEHGRSYMPWLNRVLDNSAQKHAELHGCWFNREIGELVEAAAEKSGLEVVNERRHHLGTTWVFELKPREVTVKKAPGEVPVVASEQADLKQPAGWLAKLGWS